MQRIQEMWERLSGTEDIIEEMDSLVKENIKSETWGTQHPENLEHSENIKSMNNK